jgi:class 3 adenylate cyclase/tetratricopeptide (TPR) repeat protein
MERKLATVLFADLVGSTQLVATADPEIVRSRLTRFFDQVAHCIAAHGGTVEKFAGDSVMAAFGVPLAHEDDPERAVRAALSILESVSELGLEIRIGVESGEIVADEADATFATGRAVNAAARLQQAAKPGEVLLGPEVERLTRATVIATPLGVQTARGFPDGVDAWRVISVSEQVGRRLVVSVPFVGREEELELLHNTFARAVRDRRVHFVTMFGDAGVGKSRLAREFVAGVERSTILAGRCLPYGEGVTYWALAEMVKAAAGITDDDSMEAATEKLREVCGDEAVADLLALASGVLDAVGGERTASEIAWAARTWATQLADLQPLVLVFEDIHWAEEPMLDLIEHLAGSVRDVPVLILCLARADLLAARPMWSGGKVRAVAVDLEALPPKDSAQLVDALGRGDEPALSAEQRAAVLETTEGNPLFIEETVRMLVEADGRETGIPHTVQAMIAARIDRLPRGERAVLRRAAVAGRTFWSGAVDALSDGSDDLAGCLDDLVQRDFLVREQRSTIRGEEAYRFKHVLIRDVAYVGLSKSTRALFHRQIADWLATRTVADELVEIRAYHLDEAAQLVAELEGRVPADLAADAASVIEHAGRRALAREANRGARRLLVRAVELEPTLERRYQAARAAWRLTDIPAVSTEMQDVREAARLEGDTRIEGRALTVLGHVSLYRDGDNDSARALAASALSVIEPTDEIGRFDALEILSTVSWWEGDLAEVERLATERLAIAERIGRPDLQSGVLIELNDVYNTRLEPERALEPLARAIELADESGSPTTRGWMLRAAGRQAALEGRLADAETLFDQARVLFVESGAALTLARTLNWLAITVWEMRDLRRAEEILLEAIRILKPLQDRGTLVESQRMLAQILLEQGRLDEAERSALEARETVGAKDVSSGSTTLHALGLVRAAQGRDEEAERLLREAIVILQPTGFRRHQIGQLKALAQFLRDRDREDDAREVETALVQLAGEAESRAVASSPSALP